MPQAKDEAGNIWEVDAQGNPLRLVQPAGASQGRIFNLAPSPEKQRAESRADAADARSASADARAARNEARAEREWNATHNPDGSPKAKASGSGKPMPDGVAKRYEEAINAFAAFDRATGTFKDDFAGNSLTGGLENSIQNVVGGFGTPGQAQWWSDFKATDNVLRNALYGASLTAGEKSAYEATTITPRMDPDQIKANLTRRMTLAKDLLSRKTNFLKANGYDPDAVDALAGEYGAVLNPAKQRADNEVPDPATGAALKPPPVNNSPTPPEDGSGNPKTPFDDPGNDGANSQAIASGASREVRDERIGSMLNSLYNAGASKAMIDAALAPLGAQPVDPREYAAARAWMKANPGKAYNGGYAVRHEPLSLLQRGAGSALGAGVAQYANAATAGTVGALSGEQGKGALDAMRAANPDISAVGDILGGVTGAVGGEAALAARAPAALARYAPRMADALYGGLSGFNGADDGEGLQSAGIGALTGVAGGLVGERTMRGAGAIARGMRDPAVDYLRSAGVPLTIGQIVGQGGAVGRGVKKIEDALTSVPFVGNMVEARRREGIEGLNRAAFDIGAETTGGQVQDYGSAGIRQLEGLKNNAYDQALGPVRIDAMDPALVNDLGATINSANAIPNVNGAQDAAMAGLQSRIDGAVDPLTDTIDGRGFQEAYRGLARTSRERANSDYGHEVGQVMRQGQDALVGALERQQPGAYEGFVDANTANRRLNILADAVGKAKNQEGEMFFPSQLNMADAASANRLTSKVASAGGDRPFYDLATAGQQVLPSKLPDSGTSTRALVGLALGGGAGAGAGYLAGDTGLGAGAGLGATLALALGGSHGAQALASRVLLDRPDLAVRIGESLQRNARIGGGVGAGGGLALSQILGMTGP